MNKILFLHRGNGLIAMDDFRAIESLVAPYYKVDYLNARNLTPQVVEEVNVESYTAVVSSIPCSSLHNSGMQRLSGMKALLQRVPEGRFYFQTANFHLEVRPMMWDGEREGAVKENPYLLQPAKVLFSSTDDVLQDEAAMHRLNKKLFQFMHPDSHLVPVEFTAGLINVIPDYYRGLRNSAEGLFSSTANINSFYYGIHKKGLQGALLALDFGSHPNDGLWGGVYHNFKTRFNIKDYSAGIYNKSAPELWSPLVMSAKRNLIPYQPFKGDYQFTRRMMELAILNPDSIVIDERLSPYSQSFLSLETWKPKAEEVTEKLADILSSGC